MAFASVKSNTNWVEITIQDLQFMHQAIEDNDPATVGYATPKFTKWINLAT